MKINLNVIGNFSYNNKAPCYCHGKSIHNHCITVRVPLCVGMLAGGLSAQLADMIHHKSPRDPQTKNGVADD